MMKTHRPDRFVHLIVGVSACWRRSSAITGSDGAVYSSDRLVGDDQMRKRRSGDRSEGGVELEDYGFGTRAEADPHSIPQIDRGIDVSAHGGHVAKVQLDRSGCPMGRA
jgi:hypothetical protein